MLTVQQYVALKAAALSDQTAAGYIAVADDQALADWFNGDQPTFYVWRSMLSTDRSRSAVVKGATQLDALTVGKRDSLLWLLSEAIDPSDAAVRAAIEDLCGSQNTLKGALQAEFKRTATRAEKILASGTGTSAVPATLTYEGYVSAAEASTARVS
jgi:hypothetical protein